MSFIHNPKVKIITDRKANEQALRDMLRSEASAATGQGVGGLVYIFEKPLPESLTREQPPGPTVPDPNPMKNYEKAAKKSQRLKKYMKENSPVTYFQ